MDKVEILVEQKKQGDEKFKGLVLLSVGIVFGFIGVVVFLDATHSRDGMTGLGGFIISLIVLLFGIPLFIKGAKRV